MAVYICDSGIQQAEAGDIPWILIQSEIHSEYQASWNSIVRILIWKNKATSSINLREEPGV